MQSSPPSASPARAVLRAHSVGKVRRSRAGVHWFDRISGLNILFDEVNVPEERWDRAPRYVSIALTNACELRCPFCYAPKVPGRLDADRVLLLMRDLDAEGCLGVGFGGGEPTAHPAFADLCTQAASTTRLAVTFTTHGHRIDSDLADALRGNVHFVRVSMDGIGPTYERLRGRSFAEFRRRLELVATIAPFGLNVVVNNETVSELDGIRAFAEDVGAVELLLLPEQPVGDRPGISSDDAARLARWIRAATPSVRLAISRAGAAEGMPLADPFGDEPPLDAHAHLDARGILRRDAYARDGVVVGDSIMQSLDELRNGRTQ
jgi:pyruvate-formate lyase-activating enzyme